MQDTLLKVSDLIQSSDTIIINTGAGMSADSGIPTYRGENGAWGKLESEFNQSVTDIMTPKYIQENPLKMWKRFSKGYHHLQSIQPHAGYFMLKSWVEKLSLDYFVVTSNVDGQFRKTGFDADKIFEVHGASGFLQCTTPCWDQVWASDYSIYHFVDDLNYQKLPKCPNCQELVRPNIYIFKDRTFVSTRLRQQKKRWEEFLDTQQNQKILVLEIGAGPTIKTIRNISRLLKKNYQAKIVRINPF